MKCLECSTEVAQTPGKRKKQFCDSSCRSNYWQKAKRKIKKNNLPENKARILAERAGIDKPPTELRQYPLTDGVLRPKIAPKLEKLPDVPKKEDKGGKGAENSGKAGKNGFPYNNNLENAVTAEVELPPEGLTEIQLMVWKNDQKRKNQAKTPPQTVFGAGKVEKENKDPF